MNLLTRLFRNSLWLLLARVGAQGSMVIVTYLLARRLGAVGFGEYSFIAAVIVIGNVLTTFGSDMHLIREIAAKADFSDMPAALILQLLLSGLFIGFVFLFSSSLPNQTPESIQALKVYGFALIPLAFFTVFTSMLRGMQRMTSYALLNLAVAILQVIAISIFVQYETSIVTLAYLLLMIQVAGTIMAGLLCSSFYSSLKSWRFSLDEFTSLFVVCLPVALIAILGILYQKMSLALLSFLGTASMVGLFSAAARVIEAARMGHVAVFTALYPALANAERDKRSQGVFKISWLLLLAISTVGSLLIFLLAKPAVDIFFGTDYQSSIPVLRILSFTLIPYTINSFLSLAFLARRQEKIVVRALTISLLILLMMNILLIPRSGQAGSAWAILIAEIGQAVIFLFESKLNPLGASRGLILEKGQVYGLSDSSQ